MLVGLSLNCLRQSKLISSSNQETTLDATLLRGMIWKAMLEGFRVYKMQRKYLLWKNFDLAFDTILFDQEELLNLNLKVYLKQLSLLCQWQAWPIRITEMVQEFTKSLKLTRMTMMMAAQEMRIPFCRRVLCKFLSSPNSPETSFC